MDLNNTKIVEIPGLGNGLVSKIDLKAGDVIARIASPFLVVVENAVLQRVCSECLLDSEFVSLKKCGRCKTVWYCSTACQEVAWKSIHKRECTIFKQHHPQVLPSPARALIQILLRHQHGANQDPVWAGLLPHLEELRFQTKRSEDIELQVRAVLEYTKSPPEYANMALGLMCRVSRLHLHIKQLLKGM